MPPPKKKKDKNKIKRKARKNAGKTEEIDANENTEENKKNKSKSEKPGNPGTSGEQQLPTNTCSSSRSRSCSSSNPETTEQILEKIKWNSDDENEDIWTFDKEFDEKYAEALSRSRSRSKSKSGDNTLDTVSSEELSESKDEPESSEPVKQRYLPWGEENEEECIYESDETIGYARLDIEKFTNEALDEEGQDRGQD